MGRYGGGASNWFRYKVTVPPEVQALRDRRHNFGLWVLTGIVLLTGWASLVMGMPSDWNPGVLVLGTMGWVGVAVWAVSRHTEPPAAAKETVPVAQAAPMQTWDEEYEAERVAQAAAERAAKTALWLSSPEYARLRLRPAYWAWWDTLEFAEWFTSPEYASLPLDAQWKSIMPPNPGQLWRPASDYFREPRQVPRQR